MGTGYTWETLDNIPYIDYLYITKCMEYENKAIELNSKGGSSFV